MKKCIIFRMLLHGHLNCNFKRICIFCECFAYKRTGNVLICKFLCVQSQQFRFFPESFWYNCESCAFIRESSASYS